MTNHIQPASSPSTTENDRQPVRITSSPGTSMSERPLNVDLVALGVMADADALRDHLDALNEAGVDCRAVGMDARGEPFLISLSGCYAETGVVLYGNPWDNEVDWGTGPSCVECMAQRPHAMDSLHFPVRVLTIPAPTGPKEGR